MHVATQSSNSDALGRYYTQSLVGTTLIGAMSGETPKLVLDLGAGDGALTTAAASVWSDAKFFTVDIDKNAASANLSTVHGNAFRHHVGDALSLKFEKHLGLDLGSADMALCNPPYIRPKWRKNFGSILEDAGLSSVIPKLTNVTADVLFIAQNLRYLKKGGRLGLILPDGFVAGEKFSAVRNSLARNHSIERVIELPRFIFKNTEAKAHIVILSKAICGPENICIQRLEADGQLSKRFFLPQEKAGFRLDYSFLTGPSKIKTALQLSIRDVSTHIRRGNISSTQRSGLQFPVVHTTDLTKGTKVVPRRFVLSGQPPVCSVSGVIAEPGDILIARVGRNLQEKVCIVRDGNVVISDCIFRIKVKKEFRTSLLRFLKSSEGRLALSTASHGVGAKFLTNEAILNILFKAYDDR